MQQFQAIDMLFLQDLRQRYPATCKHLVTTSAMLRITSSPETRTAASQQPMVILIPLPPSPPVKRPPPPPPKPPPGAGRRAPASAGPGGRRAAAANSRNSRPQTAQAVLTRPPVKGLTKRHSYYVNSSRHFSPIHAKLEPTYHTHFIF